MAQNPMKKKKNRPNYFRKQEEKFGPHFISRKTSVDIQRDAMMVFRDIARGNIDFERDSKYFTNAQFMLNIQKVAYDEYTKHYINQTATASYLGYFGNSLDAATRANVEAVHNQNTIQVNIYGILSAGLANISQLASAGCDENSINIKEAIHSLVNQMFPYRYNI